MNLGFHIGLHLGMYIGIHLGMHVAIHLGLDIGIHRLECSAPHEEAIKQVLIMTNGHQQQWRGL